MEPGRDVGELVRSLGIHNHDVHAAGSSGVPRAGLRVTRPLCCLLRGRAEQPCTLQVLGRLGKKRFLVLSTRGIVAGDPGR